MFSSVILLWRCQWCGASRRSHVQSHIKRMRFTRLSDSNTATVSTARGIIAEKLYEVVKINFKLIPIELTKNHKPNLWLKLTTDLNVRLTIISNEFIQLLVITKALA